MSTQAAPQASTVLSVHEIAVSYGGVRAVDGVSFDVPTGSIVGLIGPNGAGKTTVFDAICGFAPMTSGRILLDGRDITTLAPAGRARAGLGRSFQDGRLFGSLTVFETLACAFERHLNAQGPVATVLRMPWVVKAERRVRERVLELIEMMGLEAFRDKFLSELSTGSRRIVDLACVLAHGPSVLLLDEPSSGIAQKETEALGPLLQRVKTATGCTMLLIEHDMPLITSVSDELIALETGRVIARGTPREVTRSPAVVEAYLGTDERIIARSGTAAQKKAAPAKKKAAGPKKKPAPANKKAPAKKKPAAKKKATGAKKSTGAKKTNGVKRSPAKKKPQAKAKKSPAKKRTPPRKA